MNNLRERLEALRNELANRSVIAESDYDEGRIDERAEIVCAIDDIIAAERERKGIPARVIFKGPAKPELQGGAAIARADKRIALASEEKHE